MECVKIKSIKFKRKEVAQVDDEFLFFASLEMDGVEEQREEIAHRGGKPKKSSKPQLEPPLDIAEIKQKFRMKTGAELLAQMQAREGAQLTFDDAIAVAKKQKIEHKPPLEEKITIQKAKSEAKPEPFTLDFSEIEKLRKESDFVREALAVEEETLELKTENIENTVTKEDFSDFFLSVVMEDEDVLASFEINLASVEKSDLNEELLTDDLKELWGNINAFHREALKLIAQENWEKLEDVLLSQFSTMEILSDEINEIALEILGDILLEFQGGVPLFLEEYEDLKTALQG